MGHVIQHNFDTQEFQGKMPDVTSFFDHIPLTRVLLMRKLANDTHVIASHIHNDAHLDFLRIEMDLHTITDKARELGCYSELEGNNVICRNMVTLSATATVIIIIVVIIVL